jgi:hypothetical protein
MANLSIPSGGGSSISKASGAEVNTGTDDEKYITAKAAADSNLAYLSDVGWIAVATSQSVGTGNTHDVTGIPTTAREIFIQLNGLSYGGVGAASPTIQFIVSGSPVTSGYNSRVHTNSTIVDVTSGIPVFHNSTTAAEAIAGSLWVVCTDTTNHSYWGEGLAHTSVRSCDFTGTITLAAQASGIRLQGPGANVADAGTITVLYRL